MGLGPKKEEKYQRFEHRVTACKQPSNYETSSQKLKNLQ